MVCAFLISLGKERIIEYQDATFHIQDRCASFGTIYKHPLQSYRNIVYTF